MVWGVAKAAGERVEATVVLAVTKKPFFTL